MPRRTLEEMDSVTAVKKVRPQFSRESWKDFRLTPRRLDMMLYLWKRRAAHTGHFMLLYGGSERIYKDLNGLRHNGYAERPPGQIPLQAWMRHLKAGSLPRVYALDNQGANELARWFSLPRGSINWREKNRTLTLRRRLPRGRARA